MLWHCSRATHSSRKLLTLYETIPCTNNFKIKGEYSEHHKRKENGYNIFCTSDDNEVSVSWEDHRFMDIMERGIHKNDSGNWEMPLPFRSDDISMPNNRSQAISRLNVSLCSFKREPQMDKQYFEFMASV